MFEQIQRQHELVNKMNTAAKKLSAVCEDMADNVYIDDEFESISKHLADTVLPDQAYILAKEISESSQKLATLITTMDGAKEKECTQESSENELRFQTKFDVLHRVFSCQIETPPILKSHLASGTFYEQFCFDLEQEIIENMPQAFQRIENAYVIFISHFDTNSPPNKQPYYDNDNLAIKGILDAVIPNLCFDDCAKLCDNIYLTQPDTSTFCELIVVEKKHLQDWASSRKELRFLSDIAPKSPKLADLFHFIKSKILRYG